MILAATLSIPAPVSLGFSEYISPEIFLLSQRNQGRDLDEKRITPVVDKALIKDGYRNKNWAAVGFNDKRQEAMWVKADTYEPLNENSFRVRARRLLDNGAQVEGRVDMNCKNRDYNARVDGFAADKIWRSIPDNSAFGFIGMIFCKNTSSAATWGYTEETRHVWDLPAQNGSPGDASGEWILAINNDNQQGYFNDQIIRLSSDTILVATYDRMKKGDRSAAQASDTAVYMWMAVSCKMNRYSLYYKPTATSYGFWMPPKAGMPAGSAMKSRKIGCK